MSMLDPQEWAEAWIKELEARLSQIEPARIGLLYVMGNDEWVYDRFVGPRQPIMPAPVWQIRRYPVVDKPCPARKPKPNKGPQPRGQHWSK